MYIVSYRIEKAVRVDQLALYVLAYHFLYCDKSKRYALAQVWWSRQEREGSIWN